MQHANYINQDVNVNNFNNQNNLNLNSTQLNNQNNNDEHEIQNNQHNDNNDGRMRDEEGEEGSSSLREGQVYDGMVVKVKLFSDNDGGFGF